MHYILSVHMSDLQVPVQIDTKDPAMRIHMVHIVYFIRELCIYSTHLNG